MEKEAQFLIDNKLYKQDQLQLVSDLLEGHERWNTLTVLKDLKGIYGLARWNVETIELAHVIDVAIRKDKRRTKVLKQLIKLGINKFPAVKYIRFERGFKKKKHFRTLAINKIIKE